MIFMQRKNNERKKNNNNTGKTLRGKKKMKSLFLSPVFMTVRRVFVFFSKILTFRFGENFTTVDRGY